MVARKGGLILGSAFLLSLVGFGFIFVNHWYEGLWGGICMGLDLLVMGITAFVIAVGEER